MLIHQYQGLTLNFGNLGVNTYVTPLIQISSIACALILGIVTNLILKPGKSSNEAEKAPEESE